jgi:hypothetical protein
MSGFGQGWALCGGWAIDSWLGRVTRDHADADVSILEAHQREVFDQFHDWRLVGHDPDEGHDEAWDGHWLSGPGHIHAKAADGFDLEVLLAEASGDEWVLNRNPTVSVPLNESARRSPWGLPTVVPEVLLFFKATAYLGEEQYDQRATTDEQDFIALSPLLAPGPRSWLYASITRVWEGEHPWLIGLAD